MPGISMIRKSSVFRKNSKFCKQEIYKNDHIIDIHVNTEVLTTGLVIDKLIILRRSIRVILMFKLTQQGTSF